MDEKLNRHIEYFKKWLVEENINPESHLGIELTKQTRLLFEIEKIIRSGASDLSNKKGKELGVKLTVINELPKNPSGIGRLKIESETTGKSQVEVRLFEA